MLHPCVSRCSRRFGARCIFFFFPMHTHTLCDVRLWCYDFFVCRETSILSCCCRCCRCCTAGHSIFIKAIRLFDTCNLGGMEGGRERKKTFGYDGFLFFIIIIIIRLIARIRSSRSRQQLIWAILFYSSSSSSSFSKSNGTLISAAAAATTASASIHHDPLFLNPPPERKKKENTAQLPLRPKYDDLKIQKKIIQIP